MRRSSKQKTEVSVFPPSVNGVKTDRDAWVYNSAVIALSESVRRLIKGYEETVKLSNDMSVEEAVKQVKLPGTRLLKTKLEKNALIIFDSKRCVTPFTGRSFCKDSIMTRKEG